MQIIGDDFEASQALLLQNPDSLKQWLDLLKLFTRQRVLLPTIINRETKIRVNSKSGEHVSGIKSLGTPLLHKINQVIVEKEILYALAELNPTTTQRRNNITSGVWFQTKEITEQGDGRGDSKEGFTEMDKHRQVKDTIQSK
jgi:hypothetical protein